MEVAVREGNVQKVGVEKTALPGEAALAQQSLACRDLPGVDVDPDNVRPGGTGDGDERPADTAADVRDAHAGPETEGSRYAFFLPAQGRREAAA